MKLTAKQEKFCHKYIETGNASEAYRQAYSTKRMKMETINNNAYNLLKRSDIAARVKELQAKAEQKSNYRKQDAIKDLVEIITTNPMEYINVEERVDRNGLKQVVIVKDLESLPKEKQRCIKSIAPAKGGGVRVEFYDKLAGLDRLSKMLGWDEPVKNDINIMSKLTDKELEEQINNLRENLNE